MLFIILVHLVELFCTPKFYNSHSGKAILFLGAGPVAPLLMIVLGYFLIQSQQSTRQLIYRGIKLFLLGMVLNTVLNLNLFIAISKGVIQGRIWPYIFGVDILQFAGIAIVILALTRNFLKQNIIVLIAGIIAIPLLSTFVFNTLSVPHPFTYITTFIGGNETWSYFPLFPWLAYPLMGMFIYLIKNKYSLAFLETKIFQIICFIVCAGFIWFTKSFSISITTQLPLYYHHGIDFFVWTLLFLALYFSAVSLIKNVLENNPIAKYIEWLGKNITTLYFIQWAIIGNMATIIYKTVDSPLILLCYFIGILLVSTFITAIVENLLTSRKKSESL